MTDHMLTCRLCPADDNQVPAAIALDHVRLLHSDGYDRPTLDFFITRKDPDPL